MDNNLSVHIRTFNDKVRAMNQTGRKDLALSASEARNLHTEIFELLTQIKELSSNSSGQQEAINVVMDGGGFK